MRRLRILSIKLLPWACSRNLGLPPLAGSNGCNLPGSLGFLPPSRSRQVAIVSDVFSVILCRFWSSQLAKPKHFEHPLSNLLRSFNTLVAKYNANFQLHDAGLAAGCYQLTLRVANGSSKVPWGSCLNPIKHVTVLPLIVAPACMLLRKFKKS